MDTDNVIQFPSSKKEESPRNLESVLFVLAEGMLAIHHQHMFLFGVCRGFMWSLWFPILATQALGIYFGLSGVTPEGDFFVGNVSGFFSLMSVVSLYVYDRIFKTRLKHLEAAKYYLHQHQYTWNLQVYLNELEPGPGVELFKDLQISRACLEIHGSVFHDMNVPVFIQRYVAKTIAKEAEDRRQKDPVDQSA